MSLNPTGALSVMQCVYASPESGRSLYKVYDNSVGLPYALKLFSLSGKDEGRAIMREVSSLNRQLQYPQFFPRVRAVQIEKSAALVLMDWMDGRTLDEVTRGSPATTPEDVRHRLAIVGELCRTVGYMHQRRFVHRDLKPQNILIKEPRNPRAGISVIDFGLVAQARSGDMEGSFGYAAPEQSGFRHMNLGTQSDVFSIGQIMCYLMLGSPLTLFPGDDMKSWSGSVTDVLGATAAPALGAPARQVIASCLEFLPEKRPKDAQVLQRQLSHLK